MINLIQEYCAASGRRVQYDKSSNVFSVNTPEAVGQYSMKSGYKELRKHYGNESSLQPSSSHLIDWSTWKAIWSLQHEACFGLQGLNDQTQFSKLLQMPCTREDFKVGIVFTCCYIWKARCEVTIGGVKLGWERIIRRINCYMNDFLSAQWILCSNNNSDRTRKSKTCADVREKPPEGWVKVNRDGAFDTLIACAGIRVIGRNLSGKMLDGIGKRIKWIHVRLSRLKLWLDGLN
ncbi:hypothetical protein GOBAR_DD35054 [Gossypium barbadense]|nr:hypothetical protein GOBAR_DD35054 [Gossypium barbadense]